MAKKVILGTDIARDAFKTKANDNFTELYNKDIALEGQINSLGALVGLGGVAESGSNENGYYVKFGDGTLICSSSLSIAANISERTITFPAAFTNATSIVVALTNIYSNSLNIIWTAWGMTTTTFIAGSRINDATPTYGTNAQYIAIGRYK